MQLATAFLWRVIHAVVKRVVDHRNERSDKNDSPVLVGQGDATENV
jgi:4-hydroxybenzoate polyprenyltransferase